MRSYSVEPGTTVRTRPRAARNVFHRRSMGASPAVLECGTFGCCDDSPNKHATKTTARPSHPVIRSFERRALAVCYPTIYSSSKPQRELVTPIRGQRSRSTHSEPREALAVHTSRPMTDEVQCSGYISSSGRSPERGLRRTGLTAWHKAESDRDAMDVRGRREVGRSSEKSSTHAASLAPTPGSATSVFQRSLSGTFVKACSSKATALADPAQHRPDAYGPRRPRPPRRIRAGERREAARRRLRPMYRIVDGDPAMTQLTPRRGVVSTGLAQHNQRHELSTRALRGSRRRSAHGTKSPTRRSLGLASARSVGAASGRRRSVRIRASCAGSRERRGFGTSTPSRTSRIGSLETRSWRFRRRAKDGGMRCCSSHLIVVLSRRHPHVHRVAESDSACAPGQTPVATQAAFQETVPDDEMYPLHMNLIRHGREVSHRAAPAVLGVRAARSLARRDGGPSSR